MTDKPVPRDRMEIFHRALIQHGPLSDRIYLMKLNDADPTDLVDRLNVLAQANGYSKIFVKVPAGKAGVFREAGYETEASIPGFFNSTEDAVLLGQYCIPERRIEIDATEYDRILTLAQAVTLPVPDLKPLPPNTVLRPCTEADAPAMSEIYRMVFASYPFPIDDPGYIVSTMREHIAYYGIEAGGRMVALSSAEMDASLANVEMTDFATIPEFRGNGFASHLLAAMEDDMRRRDIRTAYTIARAISPGMNITFAKCGYHFGGRLKNNTNIAGSIESMNVWHKTLSI